MLNTININLKTDIKTDRPTTLPITLMSQDKNNNQFILRFTNGGESVTLDDSYTVEVLTKFTKSGTSRLTTAKVRQDYATWEFDTAYIAQDETVYNYVYVRKSGSLVVSADSNAFYFEVGLSEIDKGAGKVAETYDENYEKVLADYSGALDERTTERLDEAVGDFNQRGGELLDTVETSELDRVTNETTRQTKESERLSAEALRVTNETDRVSSEATRKPNETTRISNENERKSAEVIRLANEVDRVNAENVRSEFYEGFDGRLGDLESGRMVLKNLLINGDFDSGLTGWTFANTTVEDLESGISFTATQRYGGVVRNILTSIHNGQKLYLFSRVKTESSGVTLVNNSNPGLSVVGYTGGGDWQLLSFVHDQPINATRFRTELRDESLSIFLPIEVEYIGAINLTETFGAGNEPTKSEMDELIKITGYFDEITLTQKQMLNWQLKLMRQNRNALIALGGTII